jgi:hypothetical protein
MIETLDEIVTNAPGVMWQGGLGGFDGVDGPCFPAPKCHMVVVLNATFKEEPSKWILQQQVWI